MISCRLRQASSGGTMMDWKYSTRPETTGMRSFSFGLIMASILSVVMATLYVYHMLTN